MPRTTGILCQWVLVLSDVHHYGATWHPIMHLISFTRARAFFRMFLCWRPVVNRLSNSCVVLTNPRHRLRLNSSRPPNFRHKRAKGLTESLTTCRTSIWVMWLGRLNETSRYPAELSSAYLKTALAHCVRGSQSTFIYPHDTLRYLSHATCPFL